LAAMALAIDPRTSGALEGAKPVIGPPTTEPAPSPEPVPFAPTTPDSLPLGLPPLLRLEPAVKDPVFALLVGLVQDGVYGTLTEPRVQAELDRARLESELPYRSLADLTRLPVIAGKTALVRVRFNGPLNLPIPYSILGYHPGSFNVSETTVFREWIFPSMQLIHDETKDGKTSRQILEITDVHLFGVQDGAVYIDIDAWLDLLMGDALDDTIVTCLMLCRYQGQWLGFAMGYAKDGTGRSGAFSFAKDQIVFPTPAELRTVGREMRRRKELFMQSWQAPETNPFAAEVKPADVRP
jgi:hypothetical protein